jgi:oligopeptide/dipeptide ABC transporter ATP-binding protein
MAEEHIEPILEVQELKKYFPVKKGFFRRATGVVRAVNDVTFSIYQGETLGLVGESGSGKTTVAKVIMRAYEATAGNIFLKTTEGKRVDMATLDKKELKSERKNIQLIFQDPYSSLNPRMPVLDLIAEPLQAYGWSRKKYVKRVEELLSMVGLNPRYMRRYPHAFSGGQRQRISIARALALSPSIIIADEPASALDVSVQAQILNLLEDMQEKLNLTYLFITHDLSVVRYLCDRVAVMYAGKLAEVADTEALYTNPQHPYTSALLSAVPDADPHQRWLEETVSGEVLDLSKEIRGCPFAPRCKYVIQRCRDVYPLLENKIDSKEHPHFAACHRSHEIELKGVD